MHKIIEETDKYIKQFMEEGLDQGDNLKYVGDLIDIQKDAYEIECMKEEKEMYGEYGNYGEYGARRGGRRGSYGRDEYGRGGYGNYGEYGRRERDSRGRYRGDDEMDRMYEEYGRYQESRSRYGAGEETDKSYHYMVKALEDFIKVLYEEAETEQQRQMLRETLQRSMM
jgi:hypothetical protein